MNWESCQVLADFIDRFTILFVDGVSFGLDECFDILIDSLFFAVTRNLHHGLDFREEPVGQKDSEVTAC